LLKDQRGAAATTTTTTMQTRDVRGYIPKLIKDEEKKKKKKKRNPHRGFYFSSLIADEFA